MAEEIREPGEVEPEQPTGEPVVEPGLEPVLEPVTEPEPEPPKKGKASLSELGIGDTFTFEGDRYQVSSIGEEEVEVFLLKPTQIQRDIKKPKEKMWVGKERILMNADTIVNLL